MSDKLDPVPSSSLPSGLFAAVGALALAAACAAYLARPRQARDEAADGRDALVAYLHDHLGGSAVAIRVVSRLTRTAHVSAHDRTLFRRLAVELEEDQRVVRLVLTALGASTHSLKRAAGGASGALLAIAGGGEPGALSLFRTLEALAIAVQGKRCLWRALQALDTTSLLPGGVDPSELEDRALRQWEAIEQRRGELVAATFSTVRAATGH